MSVVDRKEEHMSTNEWSEHWGDDGLLTVKQDGSLYIMPPEYDGALDRDKTLELAHAIFRVHRVPLKTDAVTIHVNMTPLSATTRIKVEGSSITSYYANEDASTEAVLAALNVAAQRIARNEIEAGDGFTVKVEFVTTPPDKEQS